MKALQHAVNRKYKISFAKGIQLLLEAAIILNVMMAMIVKANLISVMSLVFVFKFCLSNSKTELLIRMNTYQTVLFVIQYAIYLLNLTGKTSPQPFPEGFSSFPLVVKEGM